MNRETYSTGTLWESIVGYSRAIRVGQFVFVSGTTATAQDGSIVGKGDPSSRVGLTIQQALGMPVSNWGAGAMQTSRPLTDVL